MSRSKRRHHSDSSGLLALDPFGLVWLGLAYCAVLVGKWWFISPFDPVDNNCVGCVVAIVFVMSMLIAGLLELFWIVWTSRFEKGSSFIFALSVMVFVCSLLAYKLGRYVVAKLFYTGSLSWQETQSILLLDDFVPHSIGLFLVVAMIYSMLRVMLCQDLSDKPLVYLYGAILIFATVPLVLLGVIAY